MHSITQHETSCMYIHFWK